MNTHDPVHQNKTRSKTIKQNAKLQSLKNNNLKSSPSLRSKNYFAKKLFKNIKLKTFKYSPRINIFPREARAHVVFRFPHHRRFSAREDEKKKPRVAVTDFRRQQHTWRLYYSVHGQHQFLWLFLGWLPKNNSYTMTQETLLTNSQEEQLFSELVWTGPEEMKELGNHL